MTKLMIVEDKRITREGLVKLINWNSINAKVECAFENGRAAISYLRKHHVDIIITDIKMEDVDGIELAQYVKMNCPNTKVIIITAYQDFEYAHKALDFGVCGYLLKPIDETKLLDKVSEVIEQIKQENEIRRKLSELAVKKTSDILFEYITGVSIEEDTVKKHLSNTQIDPDNMQCTLFIVKNFGKTIALKSIQDKIHQIDGNLFCTIFDDFIIGVYFGNKNAFIKSAGEFLDFIKHLDGDNYIRICISSTSHSLNQLKDSFQKTIDTYNYSYLYNLGKVVFYDDIKTSIRHSSKLVLLQHDEIIKFITKQQKELMINYIKDIFSKFKKYNCSVSFIEQQCSGILSYLYEKTQKIIFDWTDVFSGGFSTEQLKSFHNLDDLSNYMINILSIIYEKNTSKKSFLIRPIVKRALNYAIENLDIVGLNIMIPKIKTDKTAQIS